MDRRKEELRRVVRPQRPTRRPQRPVDPRREELIRSLGVRNLKPGEIVDLLHKGKVVGPPWLGGIFQTRLNVGTLILVLGVIMFLVWLIMKRAEMGG